jgi:hypothetical protein
MSIILSSLITVVAVTGKQRTELFAPVLRLNVEKPAQSLSSYLFVHVFGFKLNSQIKNIC